MKFFVLLSLALFGTSAWSQDLCEVDANRPTQSFGLNIKPNYFISADPDGRYVGVIGAYENHIYDMDSGAPPRSVRVPGRYDPVFTPDGRYVTVPPGDFYDADAYRDGIERGVKDMSDKNANHLGLGVGAGSAYQSVGTLSESAQKSSYLYIADSMQDGPNKDLAFFVAEVDHQTKELKTTKKGTLCGNIGEAHTPMISPDGQYLSILNPKTRSTQIYRVDINGGPCRLVSDLEVPTGKVSFDYGTNPRRLAFHVDQAGTNVGWFSGISEGVSKDTFMMELDVDKAGTAHENWTPSGIQRFGVTTAGGAGTYYPRFRKDGTIIAITDSNGGRYSIDVFDPANGKTLRPDQVRLSDAAAGCSTDASNSFGALAIAFLWQDICGQGLNLRMRDALRITPWLSRASCLQLVDQKWDELRARFASSPLLRDQLTLVVNTEADTKRYEGTVANAGSPADLYCAQVLGMNKTQLKSYCADGWSDGGQGETQVTVAEVQQDTPQQAFNRQCSGCHNKEDPKGGLAFSNDDGTANTDAYDPSTGLTGMTPTTAEMALNSLLNNDVKPALRMPPAGAQTPDAIQKRKMTEYLLQFVQPESRRQRYIDMAEAL